MARRFATALDLQQNELQRARIQNATGDPGSGVLGQVYFNTTVGQFRVCTVAGSPGTWTPLLFGPVTSADIADGTITDADVAAANKDGVAGTPSMRTIGAGATQVVAGNDARLTNSRTPTAHATTHQPGGSDAMAVDAAAATGSLRTLGPGATQAAPGNDARFASSPPSGAAGGDLAGTYPNPTVGLLKIDDTKVAAANKDGAAATPSMRTLGPGAAQAAPGNDARFGAATPPNGPAGGDLAGTYPNPTVAALAITDAKVAAANKDGAVGVASMRTLGNGALQATAGNDARLSDARTPTAHKATHEPGGSDAMTVDAAAGTGSLRTVGLGTAVQAMPGTTRLDQIAAPTAARTMNAQAITGLADPTNPQDAATKAYVDATAQGLDVKGSVRVASTANVALPPGGTTLTIDGIALANGDRVLLKNQTTASQNGIYTVSGIGSSVVLTRSTDADSSAEVTPGLFTFVEAGTAAADTGWILTTDAPIVLNTTALVFTQFSGAATLTAGNGLVQTANAFDVNVDNASVEVNADILRVKAAGITNAMLAGAIDLASKVTGLLGIGNGGTGANTAAAARTNLVTPGRYDNAATHAAGTTITITAATHALGAGRNKVVQVIEEASGDLIETDVNVAATGDVVVGFAASVALNTHRVLIVGW